MLSSLQSAQYFQLPQIIATYELLQWGERTAQYFIRQAGHSKLSKELALNIRFPNQPHHHPLPSSGPTGRATSIFFWKPSCLVKLDSFAIGIKRHTKCINSACPHVCSRKASSVCLCVKWIRKGSMRGRLSLRVLTRSCCLREAPVSYLTGDDVFHTQLSETWMHLCQWLVSLFAGVLFFYTHSHILISLLAWKFFWANSCPWSGSVSVSVHLFVISQCLLLICQVELQPEKRGHLGLDLDKSTRVFLWAPAVVVAVSHHLFGPRLSHLPTLVNSQPLLSPVYNLSIGLAEPLSLYHTHVELSEVIYTMI